MMALSVYVYTLWAFSWGLVAAKKQEQLYKKWVFFAWFVNFLFFPICVIIALLKKKISYKDRCLKMILLSPITAPIGIFITFGKIISVKISDMSVNAEYFWERMDVKFYNLLSKIK